MPRSEAAAKSRRFRWRSGASVTFGEPLHQRQLVARALGELRARLRLDDLLEERDADVALFLVALGEVEGDVEDLVALELLVGEELAHEREVGIGDERSEERERAVAEAHLAVQVLGGGLEERD